MIDTNQCTLLQNIPETLTNVSELQAITSILDNTVCIGNSDLKFISACKSRGGKFKSRNGKQTVACLEVGYPVGLSIDTETVRHVKINVNY